MAFRMISKELWFQENLFPDVAHLIKVSKVLVRKKTRDSKGSPLQDLLILDTSRFGKMLFLDGAVQLTEADEKYYHEPIVHCALFSHPNPKSILIIGGGDGGVLREVLRHPTKSVDLVDIDGDVIELTKKYIPKLAGKSWDDPRLTVRIQDGALFIKKTKKRFDVIIIDSPDPLGPAKKLFKKSFYSDCKKVLSRPGLVICQAGSAAFQFEETSLSFHQMRELFPSVQTFVTAVPAYIGGYFSFVAASTEKRAFEKSLGGINKRFNKLKLKTEWYSPIMHKASMALPRGLANSLAKDQKHYKQWKRKF